MARARRHRARDPPRTPCSPAASNTDEIAPTALSGWITTRWPALGPELLPPRLLNAVLGQLADKGVKQKTKRTATKSTAGPKKRGFKKPIKKKQRHRHLVK